MGQSCLRGFRDDNEGLSVTVTDTLNASTNYYINIIHEKNYNLRDFITIRNLKLWTECKDKEYAKGN